MTEPQFPAPSAAQTQLRALEISEILRETGEKGIRKLQGKAIDIDDLFKADADQGRQALRWPLLRKYEHQERGNDENR
jgi:LAS superfamily LD-carboxypeptidase LdcB